MAKLKSKSTVKKRATKLQVKPFVIKLKRCQIPQVKSPSNKKASFGIRPFQIKLRRIKISDIQQKSPVQEKPIENEVKKLVLKKNEKKQKFISKSSQETVKAIRPSQVYNFSQESVEDLEDPAADIVSELIKQKKVRVATCVKGKGRPRIKRTIGKKYNKKQTTERDFEELKRQCLTPSKERVSEHRNAIEFEFENHTFDIPPLEHSSPLVPNRTSIVFDETLKTYSPPKKINGFSTKNKAVQRIVSTPINGKTITSPSSTIANISDISLPGTVVEIPKESPRPWRLENSKPSGVFYVNSNNATFNKSTSKTYNLEDTITNVSAAQKEISMNDSNAENISPPLSRTDKRPRHESLLSLRQQANPLVGRKHRSPLKTINILEVINLPPWKPIEKPNRESTKTHTQLGFEEFMENKGKSTITQNSESHRESTKTHTQLGFEEYMENKGNSTTQNSESIENDKKGEENLFGFEEFIESDEERTILETTTNSSLNNTESNETLKNRLKSLKRLRPKETNGKKEPHVPVSNLFNVRNVENKKQMHINEMLCSTMIRPDLNKFGKQFGQTKDANKRETLNLFKDIEDAEQTTFTEDELHRTYVKPYKRKRKLRENLVMFLDSDESGEEADGNKEVLHKHKYQRKEPKTNPEIEEFSEKFNEMCKEIEQTQLIVEKVP